MLPFEPQIETLVVQRMDSRFDTWLSNAMSRIKYDSASRRRLMLCNNTAVTVAGSEQPLVIITIPGGNLVYPNTFIDIRHVTLGSGSIRFYINNSLVASLATGDNSIRFLQEGKVFAEGGVATATFDPAQDLILKFTASPAVGSITQHHVSLEYSGRT